MNSSLVLSSWGRRLGKQLMKSRGKFKPVQETTRWNIVTGDNVQVVQGPQAGQKGKVLQVLRSANRILIDGVNMRRRSVKPLNDGTPGKMIVKPCTVHYSNVMLLDPSTNEPTKISRRFLEDGTKVRVSKKTGVIIPKPDALANRKPRSLIVGPKDTLPEDLFHVSFPDYEKFLPFIYASRGMGKGNRPKNRENAQDGKALQDE